MPDEKTQLKVKNFRLSYGLKKDKAIVIKLNVLADKTGREPANVYRQALEKGILIVAAQHGIDPTILQSAAAG
ncbi:MAG: hypothetical protein LLF76_00275 [Planctomycetaceae bacterium]|nr:hypothetical protein [Planctomycetaceae bacterium]